MADLKRSEQSDLDYSDHPLVSAYFDARQHEVYYRSLKTADNRRAFHDAMIAVALRVLDAADEQGCRVLDGIIARRRTSELARTLDPEGLELLGLGAEFNFDSLRASYRGAALRYHPDRGGTDLQMTAVNRAYEGLHALLEQAKARDQAAEPRGGLVRTSLDYFYSITRLLFEIALDDWSLDDALRWLERLNSDELQRSALSSNPQQRIDLIRPTAKLAERLKAAGNHEAALWALKAAKGFLEVARARGLNFDFYVRQAEAVVVGRRKAQFHIKHQRQADNALRFGAIDGRRNDESMARVDRKRSAHQTDAAARRSLLEAVEFADRLPTDPSASLSAAQLVPEPAYFQFRVETLSHDQQAEYIFAFSETHDLELVQKYAFVRLSSLIRSAVFHPDAVDHRRLSEEALLLAELKPQCSWIAHSVAQVLRYLQALNGRRRRAYADDLKKLLEPQATSGLITLGGGPMATELGGHFLESAEQLGRRLLEADQEYRSP